jgi:hypothetical protein
MLSMFETRLSGDSPLVACGDRIVTSGDDAVRLWSLQGKLIDLIVVPGGADTVSMDERTILVGGRALWVYHYDANGFVRTPASANAVTASI